MVEGKRKIIKWDDSKKAYLREHANDSYEDLSKYFGCSVRALKHMVGSEGIRRDERRRWTEEEGEILLQYPAFTPAEFVEKRLIARSEFQVAKKLRELRGTARRTMKNGALVPSRNLAYLVGAICSDGCLNESGLTMVQKKDDAEFLDEVERCVKDSLGLPVKRDVVKRWSDWKGVRTTGEYAYLGVYSVDLLRKFATKEGLDVKNVRGRDGEWVRFIDEKFAWVWGDEYFWSFMGGLFDGDGHADWRKATIGIKPRESAMRVVEELKKKGIECGWDGTSVYVNGGGEGRCDFVDKLDNVLKRKNDSSGAVLKEGVGKVHRFVAEEFFAKHHYTSSLPGGVYVYGVVENGVMVACAAFGALAGVQSLPGKSVELKRFAADGTIIASEKVGAVLRRLVKDKPDVELVVSFADEAQGHKGTIYKATNAIYMGNTGETIRVVDSETGRSFGGRYLAQTLRHNKVDVAVAKVEIVPGKHKFVHVVAKGKRREELINALAEMAAKSI